MKKIKFLSFATMVALMTLGLSSCEKENFSMDIEIPQASPAVVSISPNVIALIDGIATNVTYDDATTIDCPLPVADEKTGEIPATDVTISVSYEAEVKVENGETLTTTLTAEEIVKVPALGRGMSCTLTPTIFLSIQTKENAATPVKGTESTKTTSKPVTVKNTTNYFYTDVEGNYTYKAGTEVDRNSIKWLQESYKNDYEIKNIINSHNQLRTETKKIDKVVVYAQSQTIITATTEEVTTEYTIKKKVAFARAEETEIEIVKFNVIEYRNTTDNHAAGPKTENPENGYDVDINLNGVGHGHGHGTGHGHGNSANAGGGIIWGE